MTSDPNVDCDCVVDVNVLVYFRLPGQWTEDARRLRELTDGWYVPLLWRSEFRNVLRSYMVRGDINLAQACAVMRTAEHALFDFEEPVNSLDVLNLVAQTSLSAYECEYAALAIHRDLPFVTADRRLVSGFPERAIRFPLRR